MMSQGKVFADFGPDTVICYNSSPSSSVKDCHYPITKSQSSEYVFPPRFSITEQYSRKTPFDWGRGTGGHVIYGVTISFDNVSDKGLIRCVFYTNNKAVSKIDRFINGIGNIDVFNATKYSGIKKTSFECMEVKKGFFERINPFD
tara:strand:- start:6087 stop:6521 length:435 start_codon:yes stop_codon:yes gene_type:complete